MGVQSLSNKQLLFMNRDHNASEALSSIESACLVFPDRVSLDFIWGLPDQTLKEWQSDLEFITTKLPLINHLSLYQLMIERGTLLFDRMNLENHSSSRNEVLEEMGELTNSVKKFFTKKSKI